MSPQWDWLQAAVFVCAGLILLGGAGAVAESIGKVKRGFDRIGAAALRAATALLDLVTRTMRRRRARRREERLRRAL